MKRYLLIAIALLLALPAIGQRFKPYHAFGLQANLKSEIISKNQNNYKAGPDFDAKLYPDILVSYDYAFLKWLGLSSGIGISGWGGTGRSSETDIYYLKVPLKLQIKAGFFWIEPTLTHNLYLWHETVKGPFYIEGNRMIAREHIQTSYWTFSNAFRFELFRGLSTNFGMGISLSDAATIPSPEDPENSYTYYTAIQFFAGFRYMFNQPYD